MNTSSICFTLPMPSFPWCWVYLFIYYHWLGRSLFLLYKRTVFWPSYCQISNDLDKILHIPICIRNTLVGRLRPRSVRGRLQGKPKRLKFFLILVTHPKSYIDIGRSDRYLICPSSPSCWNDWSASSFWDTPRTMICFPTFSRRIERITRRRRPFSESCRTSYQRWIPET